MDAHHLVTTFCPLEVSMNALRVNQSFSPYLHDILLMQ